MDKSMNFLFQLEKFWKVSVIVVKKLPYLSCGKVLLSYGKDWSSVKCQWNTFILFISIKSKLAMITDLDKKCLEESNITPLWVKRGKSITCVEFTKYWKMRKMDEFGILLPKLFWPILWEKIVLVIEKNLQNFWDP